MEHFEFTVYKTFTGEVVSSGYVVDRRWAYLQAGDNESIYFGKARWDQYFDENGALHDMPAKTHDEHVFDYSVREWVDPRTATDLRAQLKAAAAERRWLAETAGIVRSGVEIDTSREARAAFAQTFSDMASAGLDQIDFKARNGFVTLTLAQMQGIAQAVTLHVQSCFTRERAEVEAIDALTDLESLRSYTAPT